MVKLKLAQLLYQEEKNTNFDCEGIDFYLRPFMRPSEGEGEDRRLARNWGF